MRLPVSFLVVLILAAPTGAARRHSAAVCRARSPIRQARRCPGADVSATNEATGSPGRQ